MAGTNPDLGNRFTHHPPRDATQVNAYETVRAKGLEFAELVDSLCPSGREQSLAITKIEEAVFWANAAVARNQ